MINSCSAEEEERQQTNKQTRVFIVRRRLEKIESLRKNITRVSVVQHQFDLHMEAEQT